MAVSPKTFAERLNQCLNETEAPGPVRDRAIILSKMMEIPRQTAWSLLEGQVLPDEMLLQKFANEFEVDIDWLIGKK